ncbi:hypothetical protein NDU88_002984 [Pleurodeles waltl]|uniref:Uncharacterized protein n=1 Tax=Pleurodeles waltl TaxID=8319 RepID=A0AAV7W4Q4_PLEWA|nr:hypothetical protein NDU88_002984 [Pleurodeles waltl]
MSLALLRRRGVPKFRSPGRHTFTGSGRGALRSPHHPLLVGGSPAALAVCGEAVSGPEPQPSTEAGRGSSHSVALTTHRFSLGSAERVVLLRWGRRSAAVLQGL